LSGRSHLWGRRLLLLLRPGRLPPRLRVVRRSRRIRPRGLHAWML